MKEIALYGKYSHLSILVDDEDYEQVAAYRWLYFRNGSNVYARRSVKDGGLWKQQMLHTFLTGWSLVDHRNHNGLDNRRENLRPATQAENLRNKKKYPTKNGLATASRFKGVARKTLAQGDKWRAQISLNRRQKYLGTFATEVEAALAYDRAALELFGEFASLNFPGGCDE